LQVRAVLLLVKTVIGAAFAKVRGGALHFPAS
jgi:hypothetical protein